MTPITVGLPADFLTALHRKAAEEILAGRHGTTYAVVLRRAIASYCGIVDAQLPGAAASVTGRSRPTPSRRAAKKAAKKAPKKAPKNRPAKKAVR